MRPNGNIIPAIKKSKKLVLITKTFLSLQSQIKNLDVAQLVAHLVRDQEVEGSSPFIQTNLRPDSHVGPYLSGQNF